LNFSFGFTPRVLAERLVGASYSDLEGFTSDIARGYVLALPAADAKAITSNKLQQWKARYSVKKKAKK
jgi:hypothetical protein